MSDWQKSSYCGESSNCIQLATTGPRVALRESTAPGVVVTTTPARLRAFLARVKAGAADVPRQA
ncbi:DUF397 domain-containing protein [Streptomyces sp. H39-S7]|uniref:DUF397 domain-containing protein n=1 Tax=Streptomyces sp. H39-S7 TaxID=3004357 RepID=UPI0022AE7858|nr:DUF397 domain-containing protein [Streptomyces sp. H39-S7]MCZ4121678.1 DUF397 domain-containing protein [Streptomyces sp. H39-S7]